MTTLVAGATGATGQLLVQQLLDRGEQVKAIVRSSDKLPQDVRDHANLTLIQSSLLDLSDTELAALVKDCSAVVSCLTTEASIPTSATCVENSNAPAITMKPFKISAALATCLFPATRHNRHA